MSEEYSRNKRGLKRYQDDDFDDDDDSGGDSGNAGGVVKPRDITIFHSSLKEETTKMENERRWLEQAGHRQYAVVNARDKPDHPPVGNTANLQQGVKQHPLLQTQRFDGVAPSLNAAPPDNPDALAQFENERAEQDKEKQLRLGNELQLGKRFDATPKLTRH